MRLSSAVALLASFAALPARAAVFRDQVGHTDFHHALVGLPQSLDASFFLRPRLDEKASLLYTLTDAAGGVLAAVNPSSGALVWRQLLAAEEDQADNDTADAPSASAGHVVAVSGEGWLAAGLGPAVHAWNAVSGRGIWRADFSADVAGLAVVPPASSVSVSDGAAARTDVLALFSEQQPSAGAVLRRLSGVDGRVLWEARDAAGHGLLPLHVAVSADQAFVVGLHGAAQLKVLVLDLHTGQRVGEHTLAADATAASVLFVGNGGADPATVPSVVVWTDSARTKLHVHVLPTSSTAAAAAGKHQKHDFALPPDTDEVLVHAVRQPQAAAQALPLHFLVHTRDTRTNSHGAQVYHVDATTRAVTKAYDLPQALGVGAFAASAGAVGDSSLYFTRITDDEVVLMASTSDSILGRWPLAQKQGEQPVASRVARLAAAGAAAAEVVAKPGGDGYAVRAAVVTADDDWVLVLNGQVAWTRPEGLTGAVAAVLAERPETEQQLVRAALEQEAHSNPLAGYAHRVRRHVDDLQHLPAYLQAVPGRLMRSVFGAAGSSSSGEKPADDSFGFHKLAILATRRGRLYGLDAASPGAVQWTTKVAGAGVGAAPWAVQSIHVDEATGVALVVGPTVRESVLVRIATGELLPLLDNGDDVPAFAAGLLAVDPDAALASTAVVTSAGGDDGGARWVLALPRDGALLAAGGAIPAARCPKESLVVRASGGGDGLQGLRFVVAAGGTCTPQTTWTYAPPPGFRIATVATRTAHEPVASIGRVLADRRVLYKYLNPNLAVVAAVDEAAAVLLTVLLDTVSGQVLATATHRGVDARKPVDCLLVENSFLCTYFGDDETGATGATGAGAEAQTIKSYQLALSDLYESRTPNERSLQGRAGVNVSAVQPLATVDSGGGLLPAVFSQTWVVPTRLTALAVTQTRQGISVREVVAYAPRLHGVVGLPRVGGVLDARRPVGRDATAGEATEEGLARYAPQLAAGALVDGRMMLTHARDVAGVRALVTAATHVESTSLVLAYGALDVFGTRVAPSLAFDLLDAGFNKVSMLATVAALAVGVAVVRPLVSRKQIDLRWRAPL